MALLKRYLSSTAFWMLLAYCIGAGTFGYLYAEVKDHSYDTCVGQNTVRSQFTDVLELARRETLKSEDLTEERKRQINGFYMRAKAKMEPREC